MMKGMHTHLSGGLVVWRLLNKFGNVDTDGMAYSLNRDMRVQRWKSQFMISGVETVYDQVDAL